MRAEIRKRHRWLLAGLAAMSASLLFVAMQAGLLGLGPALARAEEGKERSIGGGSPVITLTLVTDGLSEPVYLTHAGDDSGRLFLVERSGVVRIFENGALRSTPFLDIQGRVESASCSECGLLSVAFSPDFAQSGRFYVNYTANDNPVGPGVAGERDGPYDTVIARFTISSDPNVADPDSEERVLLVNQPNDNHNGGQVNFGPDGEFYVGMGDGGAANDPRDIARNPASLLGKMLRIHVTDTGTYTVPADNPFVGQAGYRPEIWALGLRNPWRWSFDRTEGDLYIGDVGQRAFEEIDFEAADDPGGRDFGWDVMEGFSCFDDPNESGDGPGCDQTGLTLPIHDYSHSLGIAVSGGYVYRGAAPALQGIYFYGDYGSGRIWGLRRVGNDWVNQEFLNTAYRISSFGEDQSGELYVVDLGGSVYRIGVVQNLDLWNYLPLYLRNEASPEP